MKKFVLFFAVAISASIFFTSTSHALCPLAVAAKQRECSEKRKTGRSCTGFYPTSTNLQQVSGKPVYGGS